MSRYLVTIGGEVRSVRQWCRRYGINESTVYERMARGWPRTEAITRPVHEKVRGAAAVSLLESLIKRVAELEAIVLPRKARP